MCLDPTTLAALSFATQATSAVYGYMAQSAQADAQEQQNRVARDLFAQEESLARMDLERQRQQEYEAAAAEANQYAAAARREMATFDALIGEGAAGNTANRRMAAIGIRQGEDLATLKTNANRVQSELGFQASAISNQRIQKVASLRAPERPSLFGTALTIGAAGIQYGNNLNRINGKPTIN